MMNEEIEKMFKSLRLRGLLDHWDEYLKLARKRNFSHVRLLKYVIEQEYEIKRENSRKHRIDRAKIPEKFVIETYPFKKQPKLNKKKVLSIYDSFNYMKKNQNVIWIGPTGVGKTGLATGFLINAINQGYTGRYIMFSELINELFKSAADHSEEKILKKFISYQCLLVDEMGYIEIEPTQTGLFFNLMQKRQKKKTTLITSNLGFDDWSSFLKNRHLTDALLSRLTETSHVIKMINCVSLRPRLEQA